MGTVGQYVVYLFVCLFRVPEPNMGLNILSVITV